MSQAVFPRARRVRARRRRARRSLDRPPIPDPGAGPAGRARGARRPRPLADGLGQDARLRAADRRAHRARRRPPVGARARPDARARGAGDRGARAARAGQGPSGRGRVRRRAAPMRRRSASRSAHILVATPGRLEDLAERRLVDLSQVRIVRPRRGRPDARHGLPAPGRQARPPAAAQPPDDVLLGHARRRGRRARPRLHEQPLALRGRALDHAASPARSSTTSSR